MRQHFTADWAFGIRGAIEKVVRTTFPSELRLWPLLPSFNFEAYTVGTDYFVMVLRDKLSGTPAGPGQFKPFPFTDHPSLPLSSANIADWLSYLVERFSLRTEDIGMILPIHDSGRNDASADYELFCEQEKALWDYQLRYCVLRQKPTLTKPVEESPQGPINVTYNLFGTSSRVNINSSDSSINVIDQTPQEVFEQLLAEIRRNTSDSDARQKLETAVEDMKGSYGTGRFMDAYRSFMSILADHIQVFGPIVAPYLPILAQLIA